MSRPPKRRLLDQLGSASTFIAAGCRINGDIETEGSLILCGAVHGDGKIGEVLSMSVESQWEGEVHARRAVVAGRITGRLVVEDKLEIGATAVIRAQVTAQSIAIARGARIDGEVTVTSGQPIVNFDERRSTVSAATA